MYVRFATYHSHSGGRRRFILLLLTGRSLLFQISAHRSHVHVHIQIDRRIPLERQSIRRSIGLRGSASGISQPHLSERRCSSLRRTTSVLSKRHDVPQHTFRQSGLRIGLRATQWRWFRFYFIYRNRTYDRHDGRFIAACMKSRTNATFYDDKQVRGCTRVWKNWRVTSENSSRHLNPRRNDSEANSHRSRVLDRSRSSFSRHDATQYH